jgi:hypothetical protein
MKMKLKDILLLSDFSPLLFMYNEFCDLVWDEYFDYGIIGSYDWMTDETFLIL